MRSTRFSGTFCKVRVAIDVFLRKRIVQSDVPPQFFVVTGGDACGSQGGRVQGSHQPQEETVMLRRFVLVLGFIVAIPLPSPAAPIAETGKTFQAGGVTLY